jgi:hypothetical protein
MVSERDYSVSCGARGCVTVGLIAIGVNGDCGEDIRINWIHMARPVPPRTPFGKPFETRGFERYGQEVQRSLL